jgi:UBA-like domain
MPTSQEKAEIVIRFREITNASRSDDECIRILERHNWEIEASSD